VSLLRQQLILVSFIWHRKVHWLTNPPFESRIATDRYRTLEKKTTTKN
jgi:hypothetical protein